MNDPIINPWMIYLVTRLGTIRELFQIVSFFSAIPTVFLIILFRLLDRDDKDRIIVARYLKISITIFSLSLVSFVACPNTKEAIAILAAKKTTYAAVEKLSDEAEKVYERVRDDILSTLKERTP